MLVCTGRFDLSELYGTFDETPAPRFFLTGPPAAAKRTFRAHAFFRAERSIVS